MTKDNEDALRCADALEGKRVYDDSIEWAETLDQSAAHLRRLVTENEAKDALLRQAVEALEWAGHRGALVAAIRQHLEGKA